MQKSVDLSGQPFHFLGIGGIGMSALAHILTQRGLPVSGSDVRSTHITQRLQDGGARIFWQQKAENLDDFRSVNTPSSELPQVICSTAIQESNPEYQAAVQLGCPIFHRSDVLAALIAESPRSISVAGTHGKTTTSSLIGHLCVESALDPTIIIGGEVQTWGGNARVGKSEYLVAEADESDGSLVKFHSHIGVITNIELDHPDHYTSLDQVIAIFETFVKHCTQVVVSYDCPNIRQHFVAHPTASVITYSLDPQSGSDYTAELLGFDGTGTSALIYERGQRLGEISIPLLGHHNLSNTLAAIAVCRLNAVPFEVLTKGLLSFGGARRRFELRGEAQGIRFIDDYAHHPSEIQATLAAAKLQAESTAAIKRIVAVFQPHRFSRSLTFLEEFSQSFGDADHVVVADIYSAGETPPEEVRPDCMATAIAQHHPATHYGGSHEDISAYLKQFLRSGDLVIFLGAGDINKQIPPLLAHFQQLEQAVIAEVALR
jgi:UDP-N-acetylmuramate--alanine ligase